MKKWFWALLAVWMIAGSFSVTIRADRVVGNENGDISDGAGDIPNASGSSSEIKVMVSDVASRYAVDVTFPQLTVVFGKLFGMSMTAAMKSRRMIPVSIGLTFRSPIIPTGRFSYTATFRKPPYPTG